MKRSELLKEMISIMAANTGNYQDAEEQAPIVLKRLEELGMVPPAVPAVKIRGEDFPWGGGCTMRCVCDECHPNHPMHAWEKE